MTNLVRYKEDLFGYRKVPLTKSMLFSRDIKEIVEEKYFTPDMLFLDRKKYHLLFAVGELETLGEVNHLIDNCPMIGRVFTKDANFLMFHDSQGWYYGRNNDTIHSRVAGQLYVVPPEYFIDIDNFYENGGEQARTKLDVIGKVKYNGITYTGLIPNVWGYLTNPYDIAYMNSACEWESTECKRAIEVVSTQKIADWNVRSYYEAKEYNFDGAV